MKAGTKMRVVVIAPVENQDSFSIGMAEIARVDVLIRDQPEPAAEEGAEVCQRKTAAEVGYVVKASQEFTVPKSLGVTDVSITIQSNSSTRTFESAIDHGYYYVDLGLFVPFTVNGKRTIDARNVGSERYVTVDDDLRVTAGIAMNVFPGGRRRGELTPWSNLPECSGNETTKSDKRACKRALRSWAEFMGLQIGADLDVRDPIDQFYFGVVFEPVSGVTFSVGPAIMKVDRLPAGVVQGQLVTSDADLEPRSRYEARFYGSFGLSLDLVQAVRALRDRLEKEKP